MKNKLIIMIINTILMLFVAPALISADNDTIMYAGVGYIVAALSFNFWLLKDNK